MINNKYNVEAEPIARQSAVMLLCTGQR